jgi:peptidyl-prolyl cis-trans isomerase B (cyclophilin B)
MKKPTFATIFFLILFGYTMSFAQQYEVSDKTIDPKAKHPQYIITIKEEGKLLGTIKLELYPELAPKHCHNFDSLVKAKFYDGTAFHRVIPGFVIQGGDPNSKDKPKETWGMGDPSLTRVPAEFSKVHHGRGMLSAARTPDPNSATTQFFICVADCNSLDGKYTVYGKVIEGMDVVDKIVNSPRDARDNPNKKITMDIKKVE